MEGSRQKAEGRRQRETTRIDSPLLDKEWLFAAVSRGLTAFLAVAVSTPTSKTPHLTLRSLPPGAERVLPSGDPPVLCRKYGRARGHDHRRAPAP